MDIKERMNLEEEINSCQTQIDLMEEKANKQKYLKGYYKQNREQIRSQQQEYNQNPHVKARKKIQNHQYEQKPERKEYMSVYYKKPEAKAREREYRQRPEVKAKHKEYHKEYYKRNKK